MYFTLPNLKEHFEDVNTSKKEEIEEERNKELCKTVQKSRIEEHQINQELLHKQAELKHIQEAKSHTISETKLLEFDLEKLTAIYEKFQEETQALITYNTKLQEEFIKSGKELNNLNGSNNEIKAQIATKEAQNTKLLNDYKSSIKEKQANDIIEEQLKKQLSVIADKNDALAKTIQKTLEERQEQKKVLNKKLAEESSKLKLEFDTLNELRLLLSKNENTYNKLQEQQDVFERQIVQIQAKIKDDTKQRLTYEFEIQQIKLALQRRDLTNTIVQKDIENLRKSYENTSKTKTQKALIISKLKSENASSKDEIKKLQDAIDNLKPKEQSKQTECKPCKSS